MRIGFLSHADMSIYFFRAAVMRALKELGHEVFAICPNGSFVDKIKDEFSVVTYELNRASLNPITILKNSQKLSEVLKDLNLDLLQTSAHKSNVFGTFAAKKVGIKYVINLVEGLGSFYVDNDIKSKFIRFVLEQLYKRVLNLSDGCIFVNEADPSYFLSQKLIKQDKIYKIKSVGVNTDKFSQENVNQTNITDKKMILMVARAIWHKGVREFYQASEILKDRQDCEFVYVGDRFDGNKSSVDLRFLNSANVRYLGARDDIAELLKEAYAFVLPSYKEGFARTILEAMSMGRAVVATDVSGCNEAVINGVNGLLCEVKNPKDLALKIQILLDDEKLCQMLGKNGRDMAVKEFDERDIAQKYIQIYKHITGGL